MQYDSKAAAAIHYSLSEIPPHNVSSEQSSVQMLVANAHANAYHYVCIPLTNEKWQKRWREMCGKHGDNISEDQHDHDQRIRGAELWRDSTAFRREEVVISRLDEAESVIGIISDWLELDSPDDQIRRDSEIALLQEISYASYLNLYTVILPPPKNRAHVGSYGRAVNAALLATANIQLSICIPLYSRSSSSIHPSSGGAAVLDHDFSDAWEMWDSIRTICSYHPRLSLTLDCSRQCPSNPELLTRWKAEPTRHLFIPASAFITNQKGFPVLSGSAQSFIRDIITQRPTIILSQTKTALHQSGGDGAYLQYIRHLEKTSPGVKAASTEGTVEFFSRGYQDYLQAPLQPLMDNLQSMTYETFEKDPVKYAQYEQAMYLALCDRPVDSVTVICVVGAGRGPLVAGCLRAMKNSGRSARVYAVEKNPNAFVTLQERKHHEWRDTVELFYGDMRTVELPEKVDILVSELLGSFGDNELSPECLDGAERCLKQDGISIPSSYTAYLAPLSSSKLFAEVQSHIKDEKMAETPYVVMLHAVNILSGNGGGARNQCGPKIQACWTFEHPKRGGVVDARGLPLTNNHNMRSAELNFHIPQASVLHGFAGYFEATLYGDVGLSIQPDTKDEITPNMLSWFPLFIPLKEPLYLPRNSELHVDIWRLTDKRKVWYEWSAESFLAVSQIQPSDMLRSISPVDQASVEDVGPPDSNQSPSLSLQPGSPLESDNPDLDVAQLVSEGLTCENSLTLVKVGQTALHNAGGKSSWIGL
ncbi:PRMT5-domain-containing protein [Hysterangium stoloniferum]|nr:PRMT5-domain-containing protein [Hysterangium stoloniferum]